MRTWKTYQLKEFSHKRPNTVRFHLYEMSIIDKSIETKRCVFIRGWGQSRGRVVAGEYGVIWGDDKMFCSYIVVI